MIKGFYQFIQEKVGVNLTSLKYVEIISEEVKERLKSFLQEPVSIIFETIKIDYILSRLKKMLLSEYKRALIMNKEKPTLDISKLEKLNFNEFIKFFEKRFNNSGDRFFKKIIKLNYLDEKV
jgi:hypothetical protein